MINYLLKHRDELINKLLEKLNVNKFFKIQDIVNTCIEPFYTDHKRLVTS